MSELFDKLMESAGQVIADVDKGGQIQSAISGLRTRLAEAERKRKMNQIQQAIRDLQAREAQATGALSAQVLALHEAGSLSQPELISLCRSVDEIRTQIRDRERELEHLQPAPPPQRQIVSTPDAGPPAPPGSPCPQCGTHVLEGAAYCQSCGAAQARPSASPALRPEGVANVPALRPEGVANVFCMHCGAQLRENARFCPKCGLSVEASS